MKIWRKNMETFEDYLARGLFVGAGILPEGSIVVELKASGGNIRQAVLYDPKRNVVTHTCPAVEAGRPCWHIAAVLDVYMTAVNLPVPVKGPVADVEVEPVHVRANALDIIDWTEQYLARKGLPPYPGRFKLLNVVEAPVPVPVPSEQHRSADEQFAPSNSTIENSIAPPGGQTSFMGVLAGFAQRFYQGLRFFINGKDGSGCPDRVNA
jgi:hypothetical protein